MDRPRLFARLDRGLVGHFTLVSAPAGYGKTTLLAQWLQRQELPLVWLSLDEGDNDAAYFLEALAASFRLMQPDCCTSVHSLLAHGTLPPSEVLGRALASDMEDLPDFVLVLDDFHNIKDVHILEMIRALVYQPPGSLHLIISCRADPMLPLGALRGRGLLTEIRAAELRFSADEAGEYLDRTLGHPLTDSQVASLVERTEGWIAGLHLAALSLTGRENVDQGIEEFAGSDRYVADYLMEELLNRLDPGLQRYLTVTSILDRLSAPACVALLGDENLETVEGRPVLEWLEESNLFVIPLDEQRVAFRYHHLFRELLRHKLYASSSAEEVEALHLKAAEWLSASGRVDSSLDHFLKGRRADLAGDALEAHRVETVNRERWRALAQWIGKIGQETVATRPGLLLILAWLAHERTDWADLWRQCDRAEALLDARADADGNSGPLRAEIAALRAQVSYWRGDGEQTLLHARRALEGLPSDHRYARTVATIFQAGALQMAGDTGAAFEMLSAGLRHDYGVPTDARLLVGLAIVGFLGGEVDRPRRAAESLLVRAREQGLEGSVAWARYVLGTAAYLRDELREAEEHFSLVQPYAASLNAAKQAVYGLAWIRHFRGDVESSLSGLDRFMNLVWEFNVPIEPEVRLLRARLAALAGEHVSELPLAREVLDHLLPGPVRLNGCNESSEATAIALLLMGGDENDLKMCERATRRLAEISETQSNIFRAIQFLSLRALALSRSGRDADAVAAMRRAVELAAPGRIIRLFAELGEDVVPLLVALRGEGRQGPFLDEIIACFPGAPPALARSTTPAALGGQYATELLLTNRELDVLELLEQRLTNKEIAKHLVISPATVKRHTLSIYGKLDVGGRREAVAKARHLGLLTPAGSP